MLKIPGKVRNMISSIWNCTTITIEAWLKLNMHFDCRNLLLLNTCIFSLVFIVLNARDRNESKYPSFVFPSLLL